jgi:hypothetical protein
MPLTVPVPLTLVTAADVTVTFPVALETEIPVPAMMDNTPEFAIEIAPEPLAIEIPVLANKVLREYPVPLPINN